MGYRRYDEWEADTEVYTPAQIEAIANFCDIEVVSETNTHFLAFCPFHNNTESPAFALDKTKGLWTCFNPSCESYGNLESLVRRLKGSNPFEIARIISRYKDSTATSISDRLSAIREKAPEFVQFPEEPVERMRQAFWQPETSEGLTYMNGRGFHLDTLAHFGIGYSDRRGMVIVPMHDPNGMLIGFVGRGVVDKVFKNTDGLPKSKTAWNFHRAKREGETVIIVESSFDAMRIHQAGYPNVIALLGGHLSQHHVEQINKTFSKVIIMTDFDKYRFDKELCGRDRRLGFHLCQGHNDGRALGWQIAAALPNKRILWASYDDMCVYPHDAKDAGDMTDDEIRLCLRNAKSHFEYAKWGREIEKNQKKQAFLDGARLLAR